MALSSFPPVSGASKIPFTPAGLPLPSLPSGSLVTVVKAPPVKEPPVAASSRPVERQAVPVEPQAQGATVGAPGGDLVAGLARSLQGALGISRLVHNPQQDYGL